MIVNNTQRDPTTPWKTPDGEWRLRTYDSMFYGAASDEDLLAGKVGETTARACIACARRHESDIRLSDLPCVVSTRSGT